MIHTSLLSLLFSTSLWITNTIADTSIKNLAIAQTPKTVMLTVYNNDLAMIHETRRATLDKRGKVKLMYPGIPSSIDTSSVIASFEQEVQLFSQNYSFDVISYDSLLNHHIGKRVLYTEKDDSVEIKEGILLSTSPLLIREKNYGAIYIPNQLFFPNIPKDMAVKPSLFWNIQTDAKELDIDLKYLTKGMSWKSDYTLNIIDESRLNLNAWITIINNSGATYTDANITVLAGEVQQARPTPEVEIYKSKKLRLAPTTIQNESFSGYHIYKIPFKETIKNREQKQISFIQKEDISYNRYAINSQSFHFSNFGKRKLSFNQTIEFSNSQKNNLGIPLPKGTVRVYQEDKSKTSRFVGSQSISNIPQDEKVKIVIGKHFDIVGTESILDFKETKREKHISYKVSISNHSTKDEIVKLKRNVPKNSGKLTIKDSCNKECSKEKISAFTTLYSLKLKAKENYTLNISYDIKKY